MVKKTKINKKSTETPKTEERSWVVRCSTGYYVRAYNFRSVNWSHSRPSTHERETYEDALRTSEIAREQEKDKSAYPVRVVSRPRVVKKPPPAQIFALVDIDGNLIGEQNAGAVATDREVLEEVRESWERIVSYSATLV